MTHAVSTGTDLDPQHRRSLRLKAARRKRRPRCMHSQRQHQQRRTGTLAASAPSTAATAEATAASGAFAEELGVLDEEQAAMMAEECILVDRHDRPTGRASKVELTFR